MKIHLQNKHTVNNIDCKHYFLFAIKVSLSYIELNEKENILEIYILEKEFFNFCIFKSL